MAKDTVAQEPMGESIQSAPERFLIEPELYSTEGDLKELVYRTAGFAKLARFTLGGWIDDCEGSMVELDGEGFELVKEMAWHAEQCAARLAEVWAEKQPARTA